MQAANDNDLYNVFQLEKCTKLRSGKHKWKESNFGSKIRKLSIFIGKGIFLKYSQLPYSKEPKSVTSFN